MQAQKQIVREHLYGSLWIFVCPLSYECLNWYPHTCMQVFYCHSAIFWALPCNLAVLRLTWSVAFAVHCICVSIHSPYFPIYMAESMPSSISVHLPSPCYCFLCIDKMVLPLTEMDCDLVQLLILKDNLGNPRDSKCPYWSHQFCMDTEYKKLSCPLWSGRLGLIRGQWAVIALKERETDHFQRRFFS